MTRDENLATVLIPSYTLFMETGSECRDLCDSEDNLWEFETTQDAIDQLPANGDVCLRIFNVYYFGRLGADAVADVLFSEQSALTAMRSPYEHLENVLERNLDEYLDQLNEGKNPRMCFDGISETGVRMVFCVSWTGMFLQHILALSGDATKVKEIARQITI